MNKIVTKLITVSGKVQGVGFRYFVYNSAIAITNLKGWVKNMPDKTVKIIVSGTEDRVEALISRIRMGNSLSRVENVSILDYYSNENLNNFLII